MRFSWNSKKHSNCFHILNTIGGGAPLLLLGTCWNARELWQLLLKSVRLFCFFCCYCLFPRQAWLSIRGGMCLPIGYHGKSMHYQCLPFSDGLQVLGRWGRTKRITSSVSTHVWTSLDYFTYKSGACANSGYQALIIPLRYEARTTIAYAYVGILIDHTIFKHSPPTWLHLRSLVLSLRLLRGEECLVALDQFSWQIGMRKYRDSRGHMILWRQ